MKATETATARRAGAKSPPTPGSGTPSVRPHPGSRRFIPPPQMAVQRQGVSVRRGHYLRLWLRVGVLLAADLLTFAILYRLMRLFREGEILGPGVADFLASLFPPGWIGGLQFAAALLLGLAVAGLYARGDLRKSGSRILGGVTLAAGLTLWNDAWTQPLQATLIQFTALVAVVTTAVFTARSALDALLPRVFARIGPPEGVLFVGDPRSQRAREVQERLEARGRARTLGWVDVTRRPKDKGLQPLRPAHAVWDALVEHRPDVMVICGDLEASDFLTVVEAADTAGCRLLAASRHDGLGGMITHVSWIRGTPLMELQMPAFKGQQLVVKRVLDLVGAGVGLVLLAPLLGLLAVLVKLDSPGPIFFSHTRVGFGGKPFRMWKFRTMRPDADAMKRDLAHMNHTGDPRLFKIPEDPRVTRVGRFLRRWSLDELPQFWNVLKGEMSLVGPRPFFEDDLVRLDRSYIANWSIWLDLHILRKTVPAVVRGRGAK
ncbi:MAG: sugar transferase [Gemmatimonadota bacterium]